MIKMIPRAAGIKNYENRSKDKKDQKGRLLIKAYVAGQSISWDTSKTAKGDTTNDELVEHKDESPSMVNKVARTSQQRKATKARIVGSSDKVERGTGIKQHTPKS